MRAVPDDNLAYPALIELASGSSGSGFFINSKTDSYLVTAQHVLFNESGDLLAGSALVTSYGADQKDKTKNQYQLDLDTLRKTGLALRHNKRDVAIVKVATLTPKADPKQGFTTYPFPGAIILSCSTSGFIGANYDNSLRKLDDVLVSNDVYLFGYPSSIGLKQLPQFDYSRPLMRRGIVAGKNETEQTLILDCPVYYGNSGGPVLELEQEGFTFHYRVCGVVSQYVPYLETWTNDKSGHSNTEVSNSGYSVASSIDPVLELINGINAV